MLKVFSGSKSEHPMGDVKEARRIIAALPAADAYAALEEISHWLVSLQSDMSFKADQRAQLVQILDEAGQAPARKLTREYLLASRLTKQQDARLWNVMHEFWQSVAHGYAAALDPLVTGAKGGDALKNSLPLLGARALGALAAQLKWVHVRYGPVDARIWTLISRVYNLLDSRKVARTEVTIYPGASSPTTAEREFLRVAMLAACSPGSLLPVELEIADRVIAHCVAHFPFSTQHQADTPYWIDLALGEAPARIARPPQPSATLRFFGAGDGITEIEAALGHIRTTGEIPSTFGFAEAYPGDAVLSVLEHLEQNWSPKAAVRQHQRHRVKSRLTIAWGFDGALGVLLPQSGSLDFDQGAYESWIVENVSVGGFGALVPQVRGDWLRIGCLVAMQPEGGDRWLMGVVRRLSRPTPDQAAVGIQTLARTACPVGLRIRTGNVTSPDIEQAILLNQAHPGAEVHVLLRPGAHSPGQSFSFEREGQSAMLLPASVIERGHDYELVRCRHFLRDAA